VDYFRFKNKITTFRMNVLKGKFAS